MRVYAIQNIGASYSVPKTGNNKRVQSHYVTETMQQTAPKEISFKNRAMALGLGGTLLGAALTFVMSGGLATPAAGFVLALATGFAGGTLGACMDCVAKENKQIARVALKRFA